MKENIRRVLYNDRELSWIDFNFRVLNEAQKKSNPIMERLKFLAITASNLDEFFMVRIPGILDRLNLNYVEIEPSNLRPQEQLVEISNKVHDFVNKQYLCLKRVIEPPLKKQGILLKKVVDFSLEQLNYVNSYYDREVFPVLTPLAVDVSRPFPLLSNKSLNIAVRLQRDGESNFAVIQVPSILPRFLELPSKSGREFVLLEDIIMSKLHDLFELHKIEASCTFRITRDSDLDIDEEGDDLLIEIQKSIKKRKRGKPVRLEISSKCDNQTKKFLIDMLEVSKQDIYDVKGPLDLTFLYKFCHIGSDDKSMYFEPMSPVFPPADFFGYDNLFQAIREKDRMVHHPYESFNSVVKFVQQAAEDKNVLAIKQTLYRVSGNSPIIAALSKAAENGKQVTVLVELKARFDEENNIHWAKKLEHAGCHVIYGLSRLKTHCKILLVVRRENNRLRRYIHLATGNYNESTAKTYTDIGLFTCSEEFGVDASSFFNTLTGYSRLPEYNKFVVAPNGMRTFFESMIRMEIENAKKSLPSGITVKINSLVDKRIIDLLYEASNAGVRIRLIVRGICCLIPGIKGLSENISVISIVGRFLEHSRIFKFECAGHPKVFMGSADWMPRNLDHRVELVFPIEDQDLEKRLFKILDIVLSDNTNAKLQLSDTSYIDVEGKSGHKLSSQKRFTEIARERLVEKKVKEQDTFERANR